MLAGLFCFGIQPLTVELFDLDQSIQDPDTAFTYSVVHRIGRKICSIGPLNRTEHDLNLGED